LLNFVGTVGRLDHLNLFGTLVSLLIARRRQQKSRGAEKIINSTLQHLGGHFSLQIRASGET